jgi:hypothetical protein
VQHARLPRDGQAKEDGLAQQDGRGAQRHGLEHVRAPPHARIEEERDGAPDIGLRGGKIGAEVGVEEEAVLPQRVRDGLERLDGRQARVELPSPMVADNDAIDAQLRGG